MKKTFVDCCLISRNDFYSAKRRVVSDTVLPFNDAKRFAHSQMVQR